MNGLDSSLEALAFNPINLSLLFNNLWPLSVGVVVAIAISFRHLRGSSTCATKMVSVKPLSQPTLSHNKMLVDEMILPQATVVKAHEEVVGGDGEKFFTVYYEDGGCEGDEVDGGDCEEDEGETVIEKWTVEMRGGELGWYEYQDRNVIDGSVVRLWESSSSNSPRGCRSRRNSPTYFGFSSVYSGSVHDRVLGGFE